MDLLIKDDKVILCLKEREEMIVPDNVKVIGSGAFQNCRHIKRVVLPEGLEIIEDSAFESSNLEEIVMPDTVREIGNRAFCYSRLEEVRIPKRLAKISRSCFAHTPLKEIFIPDNIRIIDQNAFGSCYKLFKVSIGKNVKRIGARAFSWCSFGELYLPLGIDYRNKAFDNCYNLFEVYMVEGKSTPKVSDYVNLKHSINVPSRKVIYYDMAGMIGDQEAF